MVGSLPSAPKRRSYERARQFSPPLTIEEDRPFLNAHLSDVFTRRNFNRSQEEEFASWPAIVEDAQRRNVTEAEIRVAAAWGSNFVGEFSLGQRMDILERAHRAWDEADIPVTSVGLLDPLAWCLPALEGLHIFEDGTACREVNPPKH